VFEEGFFGFFVAAFGLSVASAGEAGPLFGAQANCLTEISFYDFFEGMPPGNERNRRFVLSPWGEVGKSVLLDKAVPRSTEELVSARSRGRVLALRNSSARVIREGVKRFATEDRSVRNIRLAALTSANNAKERSHIRNVQCCTEVLSIHACT
jgi:hypothetical protein